MTKGMSVVQEGISIKDASDAQRIVDTRWRYMDILVEKKITFPAYNSPNTTVVYAHNLGFLPAFDIYDIANDVYFSPFSTFGFSNNVDGTSFTGGLYSTKDAIEVSGFFDDTYNIAGRAVILRIYNVRITEEFMAPFDLTFNKSTSEPSKYGVKVLSRTSRNTLRSSELTDFAMNTQGKSLAIQRTGVTIADISTDYKALITHNLGSPPSFLATFYFKKLDIVGALAPDGIPVIGKSTPADLTFRGAQAALVSRIAYILFKDPADLAI